jgi:2-polyprenyl-6-methoxyphenol hydroxylase-like FAD-dependent oxidoreductase
VLDVFIIGGGPAGATAARLLASWGWSVQVAHRSSAKVASRPSLAESLPPSTRKLLAFLGQLALVDAAGFHPNHGNIARWAGASHVTNTDAPGLHVSRAAFDRVLRGSARASGARFVDAFVGRVDLSDPVRVHYVTSDGRSQGCRARYVLDCSGRAGVVARRGLRQYESRYRTIAIAAEWECDGWPANEHAHTIVESYTDGWAWSVPLSATRRQCTVMIDPSDQHRAQRDRTGVQSANGSAGSALNVTYARELAKTHEIRTRLDRARRTSAPWACDASLYHASRAADGRALLVGDSASFIEPLSSAGVKKALTSAWRAAVVANTCLSTPDMESPALAFFIAREREVDGECRRLSAPFFDDASAAYDDPFWRARAGSVGGETASAESSMSPRNDVELGRDPAVRLAFDQLRRASLARLRPAPSLRFEPAAAIEGREVVMREALVLPGSDLPLRFAAGVNLPALVRLARQCDDVSALISAYHSEVGPVPVQGLLAGLSLLVARHALINEDASACGPARK